MHVGFACACDYITKIASSRFPREKNRPRTPQSAHIDDGISAPVQKIPPRSTSEPPAPLPNHTFLLIDPPNALSTWHKPEGAREDTRKLSNWQETSPIVSRQIDARTSNRQPQQPLLAARSPHEFTLTFNNASADALMSLLLLVCLLFYSGHLEFSINEFLHRPCCSFHSPPKAQSTAHPTTTTTDPTTTKK